MERSPRLKRKTAAGGFFRNRPRSVSGGTGPPQSEQGMVQAVKHQQPYGKESQAQKETRGFAGEHGGSKLAEADGKGLLRQGGRGRDLVPEGLPDVPARQEEINPQEQIDY